MKHFELSYYNQDNKRKIHVFNASSMTTAKGFAKQFCERFNFKSIAVIQY